MKGIKWHSGVRSGRLALTNMLVVWWFNLCQWVSGKAMYIKRGYYTNGVIQETVFSILKVARYDCRSKYSRRIHSSSFHWILSTWTSLDDTTVIDSVTVGNSNSDSHVCKQALQGRFCKTQTETMTTPRTQSSNRNHETTARLTK